MTTFKNYITIHKRNPGHWDITDGDKRIFCIRGIPGDIHVIDERHPATHQRHSHKTIDQAWLWIMNECFYEHVATVKEVLIDPDGWTLIAVKLNEA